jgi:hypothetical protein
MHITTYLGQPNRDNDHETTKAHRTTVAVSTPHVKLEPSYSTKLLVANRHQQLHNQRITIVLHEHTLQPTMMMGLLEHMHYQPLLTAILFRLLSITAQVTA